MDMAQYRGPKIVEFDRKVVVRRYAKKFYKEISKPGVRAISFVIEREDAWNIQTSHRDDIDAVNVFLKAAHIMGEP